MKNSKLIDKLESRKVSVTLENIFDNSRADSGGERDMNFLKYLLDNELLLHTEAVLKRTSTGIVEEYYLDKFKKMHFESDRHFLCRTVIQDELQKININTLSGAGVGNMTILRSNSNYDIAVDDYSAIIDVGLTSARNYFRGLTEPRVKNYLITSYFDDYMDDIIFSVFTRSTDYEYMDAVRDYQEGFKEFIPNPPQQYDERMYYQ